MYMPRAAVDVAEGEAGIGDRRVIDDRHEARRIGHERAVEQRLVPVRQPDQIDVALEIVRLRVQLLQHALQVPVEAFHRVGQKPFQPVVAALFQSERRAFVQGRGVEQCQAPEVWLQRYLVCCWLLSCHRMLSFLANLASRRNAGT
jgi:hypothetical protein